MGLLEGKKGLVFGVANDRSIAYHIALSMIDQGAECGFPCLPGDKNERRTRKALTSGGVREPWIVPCDVSKDEDLDVVFEKAGEQFGTLDFVIHSVAYADRAYLKPGMFAHTPRDVFSQALDISAYSLVAIANRAKLIMPEGGAIVGMSYYGSEKAIPGYNVMGVAKAALEACTRYLAAELGEHNIRVNTVSAGPIRTLSAMAVGGIDEVFEWVQRKAPLHRNVEATEVAKTTVYLVSDLSTGVTGENLYVDSGYNIVGL